MDENTESVFVMIPKTFVSPLIIISICRLEIHQLLFRLIRSPKDINCKIDFVRAVAWPYAYT